MHQTAVNGAPTPDLEAFAHAVRGLSDGADVRLHTVTLGTKPKVLTLKVLTRFTLRLDTGHALLAHLRADVRRARRLEPPPRQVAVESE